MQDVVLPVIAYDYKCEVRRRKLIKLKSAKDFSVFWEPLQRGRYNASPWENNNNILNTISLASHHGSRLRSWSLTETWHHRLSRWRNFLQGLFILSESIEYGTPIVTKPCWVARHPEPCNISYLFILFYRESNDEHYQIKSRICFLVYKYERKKSSLRWGERAKRHTPPFPRRSRRHVPQHVFDWLPFFLYTTSPQPPRYLFSLIYVSIHAWPIRVAEFILPNFFEKPVPVAPIYEVTCRNINWEGETVFFLIQRGWPTQIWDRKSVV